MEAAGTNITLIALQETWNIPNLNLVNIPNFNLIFKKRAKFRGGGVGFYLNKEYHGKSKNISQPLRKKYLNALLSKLTSITKKSL